MICVSVSIGCLPEASILMQGEQATKAVQTDGRPAVLLMQHEGLICLGLPIIDQHAVAAMVVAVKRCAESRWAPVHKDSDCLLLENSWCTCCLG